MKPKTPSQQITDRFLQVMNDNVGLNRRWKSKAQFGNDMGLLSQEIWKLETGATVQLRHLVKLHELTGIDLHWIMLGKYHYGKSNTAVITQLKKVIEMLK